MATDAALRAVATAFAVPNHNVTLVTGSTSRTKIVEVEACSEADGERLNDRLTELLGGS